MSFDRFFFRYAVYMPTVWLRGEPLQRYLSDFEQTQYADAESLRDLQEQKLNRLVDWACTQVPFYRERIDRRGIKHQRLLDPAHQLADETARFLVIGQTRTDCDRRHSFEKTTRASEVRLGERRGVSHGLGRG